MNVVLSSVEVRKTLSKFCGSSCPLIRSDPTILREGSQMEDLTIS